MNNSFASRVALPALMGVVVATAGCGHGSTGSWFGGGDDKQAVLTSLQSRPAPQAGPESPAAAAARIVEPAVVTVHTVGRPVAVSTNPFGNDPFFRQFFGGGGVQQYVPKGAGSGIIISSDGYILTNDHVVAGAAEVTVNVDTQAYTAKVIGTDPVSDIAVVKIDPKGAKLSVAQLGDSSGLRVGDYVIAVGNPLDVGTTVTFGIISALNRRGLVADGHPLAGTIQTDAAINPGNSGGALANMSGQVIGINEAIESPTGSYIGLGFAIPMNTVRKVAAALIAKGHVVRPYLGIYYAPLSGITSQERTALGIPSTVTSGAIVVQVYPHSPAGDAGLRVHDVIVKANGQSVGHSTDLDDIIGQQHIGDVLKLSVIRHGSPTMVKVHLRERPASFDALSRRLQSPQSRSPQF